MQAPLYHYGAPATTNTAQNNYESSNDQGSWQQPGSVQNSAHDYEGTYYTGINNNSVDQNYYTDQTSTAAYMTGTSSDQTNAFYSKGAKGTPANMRPAISPNSHTTQYQTSAHYGNMSLQQYQMNGMGNMTNTGSTANNDMTYYGYATTEHFMTDASEGMTSGNVCNNYSTMNLGNSVAGIGASGGQVDMTGNNFGARDSKTMDSYMGNYNEGYGGYEQQRTNFTGSSNHRNVRGNSFPERSSNGSFGRNNHWSPSRDTHRMGYDSRYNGNYTNSFSRGSRGWRDRGGANHFRGRRGSGHYADHNNMLHGDAISLNATNYNRWCYQRKNFDRSDDDLARHLLDVHDEFCQDCRQKKEAKKMCKKQLSKEPDAGEDKEELTEEELQMKRLMGFSGFKSSNENKSKDHFCSPDYVSRTNTETKSEQKSKTTTLTPEERKVMQTLGGFSVFSKTDAATVGFGAPAINFGEDDGAASQQS